MTATEWGQQALATFSRDPARMFDTVPLDRLLDREDGPRAAWSTDRALKCFRELVTSTSASSRDFMARLAVPLADSQSLDLGSVDLRRLQEELNEFSPPRLYLCRREMFLRPDPFEQYLRPIGREELTSSNGVVFTVYSCARDPRAVERGWEYSRIVWFNFYPADLAL